MLQDTSLDAHSTKVATSPPTPCPPPIPPSPGAPEQSRWASMFSEFRVRSGSNLGSVPTGSVTLDEPFTWLSFTFLIWEMGMIMAQRDATFRKRLSQASANETPLSCPPPPSRLLFAFVLNSLLSGEQVCAPLQHSLMQQGQEVLWFRVRNKVKSCLGLSAV